MDEEEDEMEAACNATVEARYTQEFSQPATEVHPLP
jgi:hypothetical protein